MSVGWSIYLLRCADGTLYTGITSDVDARLAKHRAGRGAKYVRGRLPVELLAVREVGDRSEALRAERYVKSRPRGEKLAALRRADWPQPPSA